jgi:hypothetical protein
MNLAARTRKILHNSSPARRSFGESWLFILRRGPETTVRSTTGSTRNYPAVSVRRKSLDGNCSRDVCASLWMVTKGDLAEGAGFEPAIRFPAYTLSRRAPSAARPPLRIALVDASSAHITAPRRRASQWVGDEARNGSRLIRVAPSAVRSLRTSKAWIRTRSIFEAAQH